ncbi:hypothetical protein C7999DRAFT_14553 [Corynascus novoguineensis]|uniref:Uncharacterized protein n=1 Tax=Corynascus novoguineensis TaxID=1126955 RepID=A0AAN7CSA7_9PEZI|nr:hypothetical protein C7999DRAFT_14553 [Corynascus novoguineensis]
MTSRAGSSPPVQKSPWPWTGRKRRNSESSLSSLREFVTGRRNSLSETRAEPNVLRKKPPEPSAATSRVQQDRRGGDEKRKPAVGFAATRSGDAKKDERSESR